MTPAEKIADRIAKNRAAEERRSQTGKLPSLRELKVSFVRGEAGFSRSETFPRIAFIIGMLCSEPNQFAGHREIVSAMTNDEELGPFLERIVARDPQERDSAWWANNMMSWFSQAFTVGTNRYTNDFERDSSSSPYRYRRRH
jgi:hypothetical protein